MAEYDREAHPYWKLATTEDPVPPEERDKPCRICGSWSRYDRHFCPVCAGVLTQAELDAGPPSKALDLPVMKPRVIIRVDGKDLASTPLDKVADSIRELADATQSIALDREAPSVTLTHPPEAKLPELGDRGELAGLVWVCRRLELVNRTSRWEPVYADAETARKAMSEAIRRGLEQQLDKASRDTTAGWFTIPHVQVPTPRNLGTPPDRTPAKDWRKHGMSPDGGPIFRMFVDGHDLRVSFYRERWTWVVCFRSVEHPDAQLLASGVLDSEREAKLAAEDAFLDEREPKGLSPEPEPVTFGDWQPILDDDRELEARTSNGGVARVRPDPDNGAGQARYQWCAFSPDSMEAQRHGMAPNISRAKRSAEAAAMLLALQHAKAAADRVS